MGEAGPLVTLVYVDANAVIDRSVLPPLASAALEGSGFVTSALTRTEVARTLRREGASGDVAPLVDEFLEGLDVVRIDDDVLDGAGALPIRYLRSLDAIHVATALITRCDVVLTRDRQMARACEELGLKVA